MAFEAATPVTPGIPEGQPLGTQDEEEGNVGNDFEAQPVEEPAAEGINIDALGIKWDQDMLRNISEAVVPPHVEDKLKDAPFGSLFDETEKNLTKVSLLICFEHLACLLRICSDMKCLKYRNLQCSTY